MSKRKVVCPLSSPFSLLRHLPTEPPEPPEHVQEPKALEPAQPSHPPPVQYNKVPPMLPRLPLIPKPPDVEPPEHMLASGCTGGTGDIGVTAPKEVRWIAEKKRRLLEVLEAEEKVQDERLDCFRQIGQNMKDCGAYIVKDYIKVFFRDKKNYQKGSLADVQAEECRLDEARGVFKAHVAATITGLESIIKGLKHIESGLEEDMMECECRNSEDS